MMRTTLAIDDDILTAAKALAAQQGRSIGEVISDLARRSLTRTSPNAERNGILLLAPKADSPLVTLQTVNALRDEAS
jgi:hypothetical protein